MKFTALLVPLFLFTAQTLWSQGELEDLNLELLTDSEWVDRTQPIRIALNRPILASEGRLAVLLDQTDLSDLFLIETTSLTYRPDVVPLPSGERELVVYLVAPGGAWSEIARLPLKIRSRGGIEERSGSFNIELQGTSQFDADATPINETPPTGESATGQFGAQGSVILRGWTIDANIGLFAASESEEALRFAEQGNQAEQLDLSEYSLRFTKNRKLIELGHVYFGQHRHLISGFSSRGLVVGSGLGRAGSLSLAALNGSSVVGWDNPFGLSSSKHQVFSGAVGLELVQQHPGLLRLDLDYLDGSRLPIDDFNQGAINDSEENAGWGARLAGSIPGQRVSFRAGYARSDFRNPNDPLLAGGFDLVPVEEERRSARYLDIDLALVQGRQLSKNWDLDMQLGLRHERVDPQYRTVGAFVQADREQNGADLAVTAGPISLQSGHTRSEDNLDDIDSILKTKTRTSQFNLGLPLSMIFDAAPRPWLPTISYSLQRTAQRAADQPINSDFNAGSHLPDQVSVNHTASLDWQPNRWQIGVNWNLSDQDNRQTGRELNDFENTSFGARISVAPHQRVDLGFELSRDRALSLADGVTQRIDRYGFDLLWRPTDAMSFSARMSQDETEDDPRTATSRSRVLDLEWSYRHRWGLDQKHGGSAQWYLRYAARDFDSEDQVFLFQIARDTRTLRAGLNLSFR